MKSIDLLNKRIGSLVVIENLGSFEKSNGRKEIRWKCICDCGNEIISNTTQLNSGKTHQCSKCAHKDTGTKRRKEKIGDKYGKLTITDIIYNYNGTKRTKFICDCDCGKTNILKDASSVRSGHIRSCGCVKGVSRRKNALGKKFGYLTVIEEIFLKDTYSHKLKCLCDCGKEVILNRRDVMTGHTLSCGCHKYNVLSQMNYIDQTGFISDYGIEILKENGKNKKGQTLWDCKCGVCGNVFQELPARIKNNHIKSCGCINQSNREYYIEELLKKLGVNYKTQYTFSDCKSDRNYVLRFDFAILDNNNSLLCLIEYDGEQHFRPVLWFGGEVVFHEYIERDNIKTSYCQDHNIPLYRLPYTLTEKEIKEKIYNILESVTTTGVA